MRSNNCSKPENSDHGLEDTSMGEDPFNESTNIYSSSADFEAEKAISSERPFQCAICFKSFKEKGHLKRHVQSVHEKMKPYRLESNQESNFRSQDYN